MRTLLKEGSIHTQEPLKFNRLCNLIADKNFCFRQAKLTMADLCSISSKPLKDIQTFVDSWNHLPCDTYMADNGRYRFRRHSTLYAPPSSLTLYLVPQQPHYQSSQYNKLNGDIARHYQEISADILTSNTMTAILQWCCSIFGRLSPYAQWHIEVHQFRIDASTATAGKPTPEGIHRDGVNFVLMLLVKRVNVADGRTQIFDLNREILDEFSLTETFDAAIVDDNCVMHGVTPIVQLDIDQPAFRDMLVITFRKKSSPPLSSDTTIVPIIKTSPSPGNTTA